MSDEDRVDVVLVHVEYIREKIDAVEGKIDKHIERHDARDGEIDNDISNLREDLVGFKRGIKWVGLIVGVIASIASLIYTATKIAN